MIRLVPATLSEIQDARRRIAEFVLRLPLVPLQHDGDQEIYLKLENLQPIGSFKLRGAGNALARIEPEELARGVYTASAGNMAQGVGWVARRRGIPVVRYIVIAMLVGGGIAGLAGMSEVAGIQHHLRPGISNNLGFMGFLASWMAGHNPITLIGTSFLIALIVVGGDVLQFSGNLPSAAMLILIGLVLFSILGFRRLERKTE